jgi:hypothetical protein
VRKVRAARAVLAGDSVPDGADHLFSVGSEA